MRRMGSPSASLVERMAKTHNWRTLALIDVPDHQVVSRILGAAGRVRLTVSATSPALRILEPQTRLRAVAYFERVKNLCRSYASRATFIEATPSLALEQLVPADALFDGVVLFGCSAKTLYELGGAWLLRVRPGGYILGDGARDLGVRGILKVVAPHRDLLDDGMWSVKVRRREPDDAAMIIEPVDGDGDVPPVDDKLADEHGPAGAHVDVSSVAGLPIAGGGAGEVMGEVHPAPLAPKRRGRPPGSRNKTAVATLS